MKHLVALLAALVGTLLLAAVALAQAAPPFAASVQVSSNLRGGPGVSFPVVGAASPGETVQVQGCNDDCSWYQLEGDDPAQPVWIAAFLVDPLAEPAVPTATATAVPSVTATASPALTLTLVAWNVESGGALQGVVADRIAAFEGVDIWGLSEVSAVDAEAFEFAAEEGEGADFASLLGTTGGADRLLLLWDADRFEQIGDGELRAIGETGRAPLYVELRDRASGRLFAVMVNHLHRSNDEIRHRQAWALNAWAATQELPLIALGDYNFDWDLPDGTRRDAGFDAMTANNVWQWVEPAEKVTTQCSGWPCRYNSVLDFVFVAGEAQTWDAQAEIVVEPGDFPDDLTTPDHRPVRAVLDTTLVLEDPPVPLAPTATASPTAVPQATCSRASSNANLRGGPGTGYSVVGSLRSGDCVEITGRTATGDWYELASGAWVAAFLVVDAPAASAVPVVSAPTLAPTATPVPVSPPAQAPQPAGVPQPEPAQPVPVQPQPQDSRAGCDPSYPDVCIAPYPPDLDCGEISFRRFRVEGPDPHGFDRDRDGIGCEN